MSYLVLARKYRPADFSSVSGQEHVTKTLANAIKREKIAHAYLFAGPRGVGKTSIARIFSKALNCEKGPTATPCMQCTNCTEITQGISLAVREIDGASHNSVDNVRELIESFRSLPAPGSRYKIYIIDEVHMLSTAAFNALLKSLEEPPPHTVFILATTEAHKIPDTVISRCQRHDLRAISAELIEERLRKIAKEEKMDVEPEALRMVARLSEGSMRDAQSLLDRVNSFCDGKITATEAGTVLGTVERGVLFKLSEAIFTRNSAQALALVGEAFKTGLDPGLFLKEFATHFRELLLARFGGAEILKSLGVLGDDAVELQRQAGMVSENDLQDLIQVAREGADSALRSGYPKYALEALVVRMATREPVAELAQIVAGLSKMSSSSAGAERTRPVPIAVQSAMPSSSAAARPVKPNAGEQSFDWLDFVASVKGAGAKILVEQLKRLSANKFAKGILEVSGPDFTVKYFARDENKSKLNDALVKFAGGTDWKVAFTTSKQEGEIEPGSILHSERMEELKQQQQTEQNILNNPKMQALQKVFPGSKIESANPSTRTRPSLSK
jgi:DNA polymerase-3 subunit gamma/tau